MIAAMAAADLTALAYLWDGSEPGWCLQAIHRHERRMVLHFGPTGPSVRDVAAMREVFEEYRAETADRVWAEVRGQDIVELREVHSPIDAPRLANAARDRGLRVEIRRTDTVSYIPYNETTCSALVIEDSMLSEAVVKRMLSESARVRSTEID